jgi:hypothetical protein
MQVCYTLTEEQFNRLSSMAKGWRRDTAALVLHNTLDDVAKTAHMIVEPADRKAWQADEKAKYTGPERRTFIRRVQP